MVGKKNVYYYWLHLKDEYLTKASYHPIKKQFLAKSPLLLRANKKNLELYLP